MLDYSYIPNITIKTSILVSGYFEYPNWDLKRELDERKQDQSLFPP